MFGNCVDHTTTTSGPHGQGAHHPDSKPFQGKGMSLDGEGTGGNPPDRRLLKGGGPKGGKTMRSFSCRAWTARLHDCDMWPLDNCWKFQRGLLRMCLYRLQIARSRLGALAEVRAAYFRES